MVTRRTKRIFGRHFEAAARRLWIVASALTSRDAVDDVIQEAAVVGLTRFGSFDRSTNFEAWMVQILRHVAANHRRSGIRRATAHLDAQQLESLPCAQAAPVRPCTLNGRLLADQDAFDDQLKAALALLKEDARACILLHVVEGVPQAEIATVLGVAPGTVASHIHRARQALRTALAQPQPARREDHLEQPTLPR